jgi:hypothetical protein
MNQAHILTLIVIAFGGVALGSIVGALAALLALRKRTERVRIERVLRESEQAYPGLSLRH